MNAPKVSFAVSVYNNAPYIERAARCLFEQTLDDLEFVFVDDASPDNSMEILYRVLADYPHRQHQVKVFTHEKNLGCAATKRDSYLFATGQYVLLFDSDDYAEPDIAEKLYLKAIETDADMVVTNATYEGADGIRRKIDFLPNGVIGDGENVRIDTYIRNIMGTLWNRLVRRSIYTENNIIWPTSDKISDQPIAVQFSYYCKKVAGVEEELYHYVQYPTSVSHDGTIEGRLKIFYSFKANYELIEDFLKSKGLYDEYKELLTLNCKAQIKCVLLDFIADPTIRRLWLKTYPEVNRMYLWGNAAVKTSYREQLSFICIALGVYPKLKKILYSRHLRPRLGYWLR